MRSHDTGRPASRSAQGIGSLRCIAHWTHSLCGKLPIETIFMETFSRGDKVDARLKDKFVLVGGRIHRSLNSPSDVNSVGPEKCPSRRRSRRRDISLAIGDHEMQVITSFCGEAWADIKGKMPEKSPRGMNLEVANLGLRPAFNP
jgi:hypothetical protein